MGAETQITMEGIVVEMANALNRFRSLDDRELGWVQRAIRQEERKKGNGRPFWTPEEDATLKGLLGAGMRTRQIGVEMHKTASSVRCRMRALGLYANNECARPDLRKAAVKRRLKRGSNARRCEMRDDGE